MLSQESGYFSKEYRFIALDIAEMLEHKFQEKCISNNDDLIKVSYLFLYLQNLYRYIFPVAYRIGKNNKYSRFAFGKVRFKTDDYGIVRYYMVWFGNKFDKSAVIISYS